MFGKGGTRYLVILLVALALVWVLSELFSTRAKTRNFRSEVIRVDTTALTAIKVRSPKTGPEGLTLERRDDVWVMQADGREYPVEARVLSKLFKDIAVVKTDHVIGDVKKHREEQGLTDSLATRIDLTSGNETASILIGKENYNQQGQPSTAVMVPDEDVVYGLSTLLMSMRELSRDGLRPHTLIIGDPNDWQRLTYSFPKDSGSYALQRSGDRWLVDSMPTDSGKVVRYLQSLGISRAQNFADTVSIDGLQPSYQLKVEHRSGGEPIVLKVYAHGYLWVVTSTANPGTQMYLDPTREMPRLFRPREVWFPTVEEVPAPTDR